MEKEDKKNWIQEFARDLIAIGGIPFFILVVVRSFVLDVPWYPWQFIIGGVVFLILAFIFKSDIYSGLALVLLVFTVLFYESMRYTIVVSIFYLILLGGLVYLGKGKLKIIKGILFGAVASGVSWWIVSLLFPQ